MSLITKNISRCTTKISPSSFLHSSCMTSAPRRTYATKFGYSIAKCLVFEQHGPPEEVLQLHTHSISPAHGESITVKILAAPVNPADVNQIEGAYPAKPPFTKDLGTSEPAAIPGNEGVVQIVSCGSQVDSSLKPGDWAIMKASRFGTWRTYATAKATDLIKIDHEGISIVQAATIGVNPCTAYRMLKDFATLEQGDFFIQNGANSGVGRAAIQLGRIWGHKSINIVRDRSEIEELRNDLMNLGATLVVTEEEMGTDKGKAKIREATRGTPVKLGLNCVGGSSTIKLVKTLGKNSHVVTYGAMAKKPVTLSASQLIFQNVHAHGFWISSWSDANPEQKIEMLHDILSLMRKGEFKDTPVEVTEWTDETELGKLVEAVKKGISGFSGKKGMFVMKDT